MSDIPIAKGFVYLIAVVDWANRKVLAAQIATGGFHAVDKVHETFNHYGSTEIVNTDQGGQISTIECGKRPSRAKDTN